MSLEDKIDALKASIDDLNATLKGQRSSANAESGRERSRDRDDKGKDDKKDEGRTESSGRRGRPAKDDKKDDKKGSDKLTLDDVRKAYGDYLGTEDEKGYDDRREFIEAVLNELGVDILRDIKDEDFGAAMHWLKAKKKNPDRTVDFSDRGEDDGGDSRDSRSSRRGLV